MHSSTLTYSLDSAQKPLVVIRGAGDIATGIAVRLYRCGFNVVMTEIAQPTMIRCTVSLGQCCYQGTMTVENVTARKASTLHQIREVLANGDIPVIDDEDLKLSRELEPIAMVDAILAKRNLQFSKRLAPITIALGPGFTAGEDCHAVIETNRGHHLGRIYYQGKTQDNTGVPGNIAGFSHQRVIRSPIAGKMKCQVTIGDIVNEGDIIAAIDETPVFAPLSGMVRGLLNSGISVPSGFKIGDIDPRGETADYLSISDKARAISGSVLEALMFLRIDNSHQLHQHIV